MALATFQNLKDALASNTTPADSWSNRTDLNNRLDDFITITESKTMRGTQLQGQIVQGLRTRELEKLANVTLNAETASVPSDFIQAIRFFLDQNPRVQLEYIAPQNMDKRFPDTSTGTARFFTVEAGNFRFKPIPSSGTAKLLYYFRPAILSGANTTNELLTNYPDIMLWGSLAELWDFLKDDAKSIKYRQLWADGIGAANSDAERNEGSGSSLTPQYYTSTP